jgi:hypothetical protein
MNRKKAHKKCISRDCKCINGKDRDNNYHEIIDEIFYWVEKVKFESYKNGYEQGRFDADADRSGNV